MCGRAGWEAAFNNAGILGGSGPIPDEDEGDFDRVLAVNLKGVWLCMKYEIPELLKAGGGVIVNTSSILGQVGSPGSGGYVASKHGVIGLTRTAALQYASAGVRVKVICPGYIRTPMIDGAMADPAALATAVALHPIGRLGSAEEVADAVLWLASPGASFVTEQALGVDGGYLAR
jgi:NAD(P)-dependent dehydrogenase (short-subunit alcohol dehydrogenase family)